MTAAILEFLVRSSILLLPVLVIGHARRLSAAERHALTLAGLLSLPLIAGLGRVVEWPVAVAAPASEAALVIPRQAALPPEEAGTAAAVHAENAARSLLWLYLSVAGALALQAVVSWWRVARRIRRLPRIRPLPGVGELPERVELGRTECATPWTWGVRRPVVFLPRGFAGWPRRKQQDALIHELAHVSRRDCLTQILAHALAVVFWFQPLVWLLRLRLGRLAEQACDDHVLATGSPAPDYAQWLLDIAREHGHRPAAGMPMSRHPLGGRIDAILDPSIRRSPMKTPETFALVLLALCAAVPVAAVAPQVALPDQRSYLPVVKVAPVYPPEAQDQKIEGYVVVEFEVTDHGTTRDVRVVEESPPGVFAVTAVEATRQFLYLPKRQDGRNVAVPGVRNRITFELAEQDGEEAGGKVSVDWESTQSSLETSLATSEPLDAELLQRAASAAARERHHNQRLLSDIIARAEAEAQQTGSGDPYLRAARLASTLQETGHAIHCLLRASELELSRPEALRTEFATVLLSAGRLGEAKALFAGDAETDELSRRWHAYLEAEERRRTTLFDALSDTLQALAAQ